MEGQPGAKGDMGSPAVIRLQGDKVCMMNKKQEIKKKHIIKDIQMYYIGEIKKDLEFKIDTLRQKSIS